MTSATAEKPPTERQRWMAAQWLARGQRVVRAAAFASMPPRQLRELLADEDFRELIEAEREQLALPPEEWQREMDGANRQAIERALADGRVSIVGQLLRLGLALPALAKSVGGRRAAERAPRGLEEEAEEYEDEELDDEAWLATVPVVEADPVREAERRRLLLAVEHKGARDAIKRAPLPGIEQYSVVGDPVAYEEWFARQPKPPREQAACLTEEDRAAVEWVTRHNPPWIRGKYLGFYRPPVPAHLFLPGAEADPDDEIVARPTAPAAPPRQAEGPVPDLQARITRLLDRNAVRLPEEIDLAEAICALKWPKWPDYRGEIDPFLLQRALEGIRLDDATLNWLGSHELTRACRSAAVKQPQGP